MDDNARTHWRKTLFSKKYPFDSYPHETSKQTFKVHFRNRIHRVVFTAHLLSPKRPRSLESFHRFIQKCLLIIFSCIRLIFNFFFCLFVFLLAGSTTPFVMRVQFGPGNREENPEDNLGMCLRYEQQQCSS